MCEACSDTCPHGVLKTAAVQQAEKLDELLKKRGIAIDRVLNFDVPDSTLVSVSTLAVLRILQPCCRMLPATACIEIRHVHYGAMTLWEHKASKGLGRH